MTRTEQGAGPQPPTLAMPDHSAATSSQLARGMLVVSMLAALTSVARVAQDAVIAWRHGTDPDVDAYYLLLAAVGWPLAIALSTLTLLAAPAEASLRRVDPAEAMRFRGELLGAMLVAAALAFPLSWLTLYAVAVGGWSGLAPAAAKAAEDGLSAFVAVVPLGLVGALLAAWLISTGRHVLTLLEALPPLVLIVTLGLFHGTWLFWGTTAGIALQVVAMVVVLHRAGELPLPRITFHSSGWQLFGRGAIVLLAGQMLFTLTPLVDPFFAARLGDGNVAALGFANRLILGVQGLVGIAIQRAALPLLSKLAAHSPSEARHIAQGWALKAGLTGVVIAVVVVSLADPLVAILYERGSFTAADRSQVASLLRWGMLQMPPFLCGLVLVTALAASRSGAALALVSGVGLVSKLILSALFCEAFGLAGLPIATAGMYCITSAMMWVSLRRRTDGHERI